MTGPPAWTLLDEETLHDCAVFTVGRTTSRSPRTGTPHTFYRLDSSDWVNVVPLTAHDEMVLVRQYRHGLRDTTLEIPGGMVDPGETPAEAAARELLEETGYRAAGVEPIGTVNPNPALFGNRLHSFVATGCEWVGKAEAEGTEETVVELLPAAALRGLVRAGAIDHALVLAGLYRWELARRGSGGIAGGGGR